MTDDAKDLKRIRTVCAFACMHSCGLSAHVKDGVITSMTPGDFPDSRWKGACIKGLSPHHSAQHTDRLRYPLKRAGERGEGKWERVSWDEALDGIADKLKEISARYGPESIAWWPQDTPMVRQGGYSRLLSLTKWRWVLSPGYGDLANPTADLLSFGWLSGDSFTSHVNEPEVMIIWGFNPASTFPTIMQDILRAKKNGCKLIVIDPRFTETASKADEYIPIKPGTDGALALGLMNVIIDKGFDDKNYIAHETVGPILVRDDNGRFLRESDLKEDGDDKTFIVWDELSGGPKRLGSVGISTALTGEYRLGGTICRPAYQLLSQLVKEYPPETVSRITDIPAETIRRLAFDYSAPMAAGPHRSIRRGWGLQRYFYGVLTARAINTLAAITGNINMERHCYFEEFSVNTGAAYNFYTPGGAYKHIPVMDLYDAITKDETNAVKAIGLSGRNFAYQLPNTNKIVNELFPKLELIVVADPFMTATAKYADYVLPATTFLECTDLNIGVWASMPYLQLQQKVIEPRYESKSDFQIAAELGRKMGFSEYFNMSEEEFIQEILSTHPMLTGITLDQLKRGPVMPGFRTRRYFKTPTERFEFYIESLKPVGQELPLYLEPIEISDKAKIETYNLAFITPHPKYRMHSNLGNVPELLKFDPEPLLEMNPSDAASRSINDRDIVTVYNERGHVKVKVKLTNGIKAGVVSLDQGWVPEQYVSGHHNELTHDLINPVDKNILGANAALCDVLVEVRKE